MKHHPIIFSIGEKTPVVSLSYDPYYVHKNGGALAIFNLDKFNVDITDNFDLVKIIDLIELALKDKSIFSQKLDSRLKELKRVRIDFLGKVELLLENGKKND